MRKVSDSLESHNICSIFASHMIFDEITKTLHKNVILFYWSNLNLGLNSLAHFEFYFIGAIILFGFFCVPFLCRSCSRSIHLKIKIVYLDILIWCPYLSVIITHVTLHKTASLMHSKNVTRPAISFLDNCFCFVSVIIIAILSCQLLHILKDTISMR